MLPPRDRPVPDAMDESGIHVFESRHGPGFAMPPERHRFPELLYIRDGVGAVTLVTDDGRERRESCRSGDCVIVPTGSAHFLVDDPGRPLSLYGLAVDPRRIAPFADLERLLPAGRLPRGRLLLDDIEARIRRLLFLTARGEVVATLSAVAGAIDIFAGLAEFGPAAAEPPASRPADGVDAYLQWMERNFFEDISVDDAARRCRMSRRSFTERFKSRTGTTWLRRLHELRISHAVTLLETTDATVTSVAFRSGFEDLSTFYRVFRKVTGRRPGDLRAGESDPRHDQRAVSADQ